MRIERLIDGGKNKLLLVSNCNASKTTDYKSVA